MWLFVRHPQETAIVFGLTAGGTLAFYTYTTYMQKFLANTAGFSRDQATQISAAALFLFMLLQPVVGALSDRIGRRPVMIAFGVGGVLCTWPIMTTLGGTRDPLVAFALVMAALAIVSGYTAPPRSGPWASPCPSPSPTPCSAARRSTSPCGSKVSAARAGSTAM